MSILATTLLCLTLNIYHEARGETEKGQQAVALVTLNRANFYNQSVCEVVYKPSQFSWTIYKPSVRDPKSYKLAKQIALDVLNGKVSDFTRGATFYHKTSIKPVWSKEFRHTITVGRHAFYEALPGYRLRRDNYDGKIYIFRTSKHFRTGIWSARS